jgi:glycosyltransferase involved in cell wall biosynthesis
MNLLIFTQKVDRNDTYLGFFHRWIIELAKHFDEITVIGLSVGEYTLPANVRVFSLGKESKQSRLSYLSKFYKYISKFRHDYDAVFVHQNQEYPIIGGIFWKMMGKRVYMWRNHYAGSSITDLAAFFCTKVFCTSRFSYTAKYKKTVFMPVGVDTEFFQPSPLVQRVRHSVLSYGRISPAKNIEQFIDALKILHEEKIEFTASIVGDSLAKDASYHESLRLRVREAGLADKITFKPGVKYERAPLLCSEYDIFVNMSPSGMLDKIIFEAMSCDALVISSSKDLIDKVDPDFSYEENNVERLSAKIGHLLSLDTSARNARSEKLRDFAQNNHSLHALGSRLKEEMSI